MQEPMKRDFKISRSKSGSGKSKNDSKRKSLLLEDPSTPKSLHSVKSQVSDSTPPSSGFKKFFNRSRDASRGSMKGAPPLNPTSSTPSSKKLKTIQLPPITSVKSKESSKESLKGKEIHRFSFQDQSSVNSGANSKTANSVDFEVPKSEVNSILNVQLTYTHPSEIFKQNNSNNSPELTRPSSISLTTDMNTSTADDLDNNDVHEDNKAGLISSFLSAAANHINGMGTPDELEGANKDAPHLPHSESKSRLGNVFASIKNFAGDPNLPLEDLLKFDPYGNHIQNLVNPQKGQTPRILLEGVPLENNLTKNIRFEAVKPSPLSTLGKGDLSLADFEAESRSDESVRKSDDFTGTTTIDRIMSPMGRLSSNLSERRGASPSTVRTSLPHLNPSTKFSDSINGDVKRRRTLKSIRSRRLADDLDRNSTRTDTNDNDPVSPAVSRVMTNGQSQTRGRFKIANEKRQLEFHTMFKQVPQSEKLLDDYSCALQKEILVQGRLFISESKICFNSNIFGWVTNFVIPFSEVIQIEKKNTAGVFPNAIQVQTLHSKNIFASLLARESTFDTMTAVWNQNLHGFNRDSMIFGDDIDDNADTEDEGIVTDESDMDSYSSGDDDDDHDDDDDDDDDDHEDGREPTDDNFTGTPPTDLSNDDNAKSSSNEEFNGVPFEGPRTHAPTENGYEKKPGETLIIDETVSAPVGVVYSLMFGDDPSFMKKYLEKSKNYDISDIPKFSNVDGTKKRDYSYVKPLSGPVGPKKTRCLITETIESCDFNNFVQVVQSSQSPDVPSGGSFTVKSTILLSWANNNSTRLVVLTSVEWTAKSWIKGAVEKGSIDGQKESMRVLLSELRARVVAQSVSRKRSTTTGRKRSKKQQKKVEPVEQPQEPQDESGGNPLIQVIKMIADMIPIPDYLKLPIAVIFVIWALWLSLFSKSSTSTKEFSNLSNISIDGSDYILLPNSFSSKNYLANKLEYDIWQWIDSRNGENSHVGAKMSHHGKKDAKKSLEIDGHSRQSLEELMKLTQMKLDEMRRILDQ